MTKNFASDALRAGLEKKPGRLCRLLLWALSTAVFFVFARYARYAKVEEFAEAYLNRNVVITALAFTGIFALSYGIQLRVGRKLPLGVQALLAVVTGVILLGKISLLDYVSDDYSIFLSDWIYDYSQMPFKQALGWYIQSDYTPPYLYLMALLSRIENFPWQYLVKAISVGFEVLMAYALMKLSALKVKGEGAQLAVYHIASILPTVVFNGAYWGQCDVIYSSFCLLALYMGLTGRSARSMILFGVGLSFKLQTVFFLPVLLPLWLRGDIKLRHLVLIPGAYMTMMIPALWAGKSLYHVLTVYVQQAKGYSTISMNAPNWYQFLPDMAGGTLYKMFGGMALLLGFAIVLVMCVVVCVNRRRLTDESVLLACLLMLGGVPLLLPKMHERYLFGADVLSLVLAVYNPKRIWLPLCYGFASYAAYTAGLPGEKLMDLQWAAMFLIVAVALTGVELWRLLMDRQERAIAEVKA